MPPGPAIEPRKRPFRPTDTTARKRSRKGCRTEDPVVTRAPRACARRSRLAREERKLAAPALGLPRQGSVRHPRDEHAASIHVAVAVAVAVSTAREKQQGLRIVERIFGARG